jgi:Mg2+/citrate symporter
MSYGVRNRDAAWSPLVKGLEAIKDLWKTAIAALGITGATLSTLSSEMAGDTVIEVGLAQLDLGEGDRASLKYIVHWKQAGGRWLWDKDIWNMN